MKKLLFTLVLLSSATYIVNALDTETNERLSYKVIKN